MKGFALFSTLFLLIAGLLFSIINLFQMQLEQGNQYPPYSTFRSDPQGSRILLETLNLWSHGKASPLLNRVWERPSGDHATWILLNAEYSPTFISKMDSKRFKEFLNQKGRLVIAFNSTLSKSNISSSFSKENEPSESNENNSRSSIPSPIHDSPVFNSTPLQKIQQEAKEKQILEEKKKAEYKQHLEKNFWNIQREWGFTLHSFDTNERTSNGSESEDNGPLTAIAQGLWQNQSLPDLPWRSPLYFLTPDPHWKIRYTVNNQPVIIERIYEGGTIILISDPSFMSNESLSNLKFWSPILPILGVGRSYWFDETHLKVSRRFSLVQLLKRSGATGLMIGLAIAFLLWIWKNQSCLAPLPETVHLKKSSLRSPLENLRQLFQYHLRGDKIWCGMIEEWTHLPSNKNNAELALKARQRLPDLLKQKPKLTNTEIYNEISEILNERNPHGIET